MRIAEWVKQIHENAKAKGWWEKPRDPLSIHMLIVSEVAEATEEYRAGNPPIYQEHHVGPNDPETYKVTPGDPEWLHTAKTEGELVELADAVIRIMDYCGHMGWDLEDAINKKHLYNMTRPYRHGGKKA